MHLHVWRFIYIRYHDFWCQRVPCNTSGESVTCGLLQSTRSPEDESKRRKSASVGRVARGSAASSAANFSVGSSPSCAGWAASRWLVRPSLIRDRLLQVSYVNFLYHTSFVSCIFVFTPFSHFLLFKCTITLFFSSVFLFRLRQKRANFQKMQFLNTFLLKTKRVFH